MSPALLATVVAAALLAAVAESKLETAWCEAPAQTQAGRVCGLRRAAAGRAYASFLGVPYAKQPLGELRFQELQPPEPWTGVLHATKEGPVCPQTDVFYGKLMQSSGMSEACIHANVHAPLSEAGELKQGLPVLVFVHGGGFAFGSGDTDIHGPDYLLRHDVVVITFNYRLNIIGFLSLNSSSIPGNNGIRDAVTLLRWVQANARAFGGDPDDVTVAGQSAGGVIAHMLSLSPATKGLFKRVISMSGVATSDFFSSSPIFAKTIADMALANLNIDPSLDPEDIHERLVAAPIDELVRVNRELLDIFGLTTFVPVVESPHPNVTMIIPEEPEELIKSGVGADIPMIIGFTDAECETFVPRLRQFDIVGKINENPLLSVTPRLLYQAAPEALPELARAVSAQYWAARAGLRAFVRYCSDAYYAYPALRTAAQRVAVDAPVYLYRYSYSARRSPMREAHGLSFSGAGHAEDLASVFRAQALLGPARLPLDDQLVVNQMTSLVLNFMAHGTAWAGAGSQLQYLSVSGAGRPRLSAADEREQVMKVFFDDLYELAAP